MQTKTGRILAECFDMDALREVAETCAMHCCGMNGMATRAASPEEAAALRADAKVFGDAETALRAIINAAEG